MSLLQRHVKNNWPQKHYGVTCQLGTKRIMSVGMRVFRSLSLPRMTFTVLLKKKTKLN